MEATIHHSLLFNGVVIVFIFIWSKTNRWQNLDDLDSFNRFSILWFGNFARPRLRNFSTDRVIFVILMPRAMRGSIFLHIILFFKLILWRVINMGLLGWGQHRRRSFRQLGLSLFRLKIISPALIWIVIIIIPTVVIAIARDLVQNHSKGPSIDAAQLFQRGECRIRVSMSRLDYKHDPIHFGR